MLVYKKIGLSVKRTYADICKTNNQNKNLQTDKSLIDYKIFVFDLDNTLYLHKVDTAYSEYYHICVKNLLIYLKNNDKLLYVATHNKSPTSYLNRINITNLFHGIIKETKCLDRNINNIQDYTNKKDMILHILNKNSDCNLDDILFFDDHIYNIKNVESIGVKCIYVNDFKGINFNLFSNIVTKSVFPPPSND